MMGWEAYVESEGVVSGPASTSAKLPLFFWCYLSSKFPELIDMLYSEEMQIPRGTRCVPVATAGSLWPPGLSALIARCASGPSTVQNSLGRKWDMKLKEYGSSGLFVRDETLYRG